MIILTRFLAQMPIRSKRQRVQPNLMPGTTGKATAGKRAAKKPRAKHMYLYLVLYSRGEWEKSCLSLAMGTYQGPKMKSGRLVTLKRHKSTRFKSDHPCHSRFALPEGLIFRDSICVSKGDEIERPRRPWEASAWSSPSINTRVYIKPISAFVQAEVAFKESSEEWNTLDQRYHSM